MAKYAKGGQKVDPASDWRLFKVVEVDHFTAMAWERNGLGQIRPVRGLQNYVDPDYERHVDEYYDRRNEAILAERERLRGVGDRVVSDLRRKYQAQGRVLTLPALLREVEKLATAKFSLPGERLAPRRPAPPVQQPDESPIIRVDDIDHGPIDDYEDDAPRQANEDDDQGETVDGGEPRTGEDEE